MKNNTLIKKLITFKNYLSSYKNNKKTLILLIILDIFLAIGSNIADYEWLSSVPHYLLPFAPICSLYPLLLAIWFILYYKKKNIHPAFTFFIFLAITSYGIMSYIYYPLYMLHYGVKFRLVGNIIWVTTYSLQSLIILSELRPIKYTYLILILSYFLFKDYSDRYLGSFIDINQSDFPENLKNIFLITILILNIILFITTIKITIFKKKQGISNNQ